ncbi:putative diacylglycerol O-acyltransferase [Helianthus annuus]|nr:putative diacylglycerol O-acyltransferase [Helianthus annuus]
MVVSRGWPWTVVGVGMVVRVKGVVVEVAKLNILAELLRFGDREFYKDWWNAQTIEEYWRLWNMPVHKWIVRHLYFPCLRNGIPKGAAILVAFFMSAVFHELCIAVPCHIFKFWAFIGIMFQVPLVLLTNYLQNKFQNSMVGNIIFWCFFSILGQPMCVLLYYHDVMNQKVNSK